MAGFVRFVCPGRGNGIFQSAPRLLRSGALSTRDRARLRSLLDWFGENLEEPDTFVRTTSKGAYRRDPVAICWFKDTATECIRRAWSIARVLEANGVVVEFVTTKRPGYVTYEDEHQVAAIPYADR